MLPIALMGMSEWIPIIIVLVLLFGAKKIPELARSMGTSINEFKKGMAEGQKDEKPASTEAHASTPPTPPGNGKPNNN